MPKPIVIILHGPAGVGKDSVIAALQAQSGIRRATSATSRAPRNGERDGVDYHFFAREDFERRIAAGEFAEWADVYGDYKGLPKSEILDPIARGEDVIIRTDVQGARTWRRRLPGAISIFLMAEDREALRARLIDRGSETDDTLARRLGELEEELSDIPHNDYVVFNRHGALPETVREVREIIERERANETRPAPTLLDDDGAPVPLPTADQPNPNQWLLDLADSFQNVSWKDGPPIDSDEFKRAFAGSAEDAGTHELRPR